MNPITIPRAGHGSQRRQVRSRVHRVVPLAAAGAAAVTVIMFAPSPADAAGWWTPAIATTQSWQWQISNCPVPTTYNVQVYDIDYDGAQVCTRAQVTSLVSTLHAQGKKVIAYIDIGTWESYRPDASQFAAAWEGKTVSGYSNEKWLDLTPATLSQTGPAGLTLRQIMDNRFAQAKAEGFDAVETDNDDGYAEPTGFTISISQTEAADEALASDIHNLGMAWFEKNGVNADSFLTDLLAQPAQSAPDGTINEQCHQYNECGALAPFISDGKPVLNAEYKGQQGKICPEALSEQFATARFNVNLDGAPVWVCW